MNKIILVLGMLILGCASAQTELMLHGVKIEQDKLQILVDSTGCTTGESFQLLWQQDVLSIVRVKADNCRRMPHQIWLSFDLPKDKTAFKLSNTISKKP